MFTIKPSSNTFRTKNVRAFKLYLKKIKFIKKSIDKIKTCLENLRNNNLNR